MFTGKRARDKATVAPREKLLKQRCSSTAFRDKPSADASGVHRFVPESQPIMSTPLVIIAFSLLACNSFFNQAPRISEAAKNSVRADGLSATTCLSKLCFWLALNVSYDSVCEARDWGVIGRLAGTASGRVAGSKASRTSWAGCVSEVPLPPSLVEYVELLVRHLSSPVKLALCVSIKPRNVISGQLIESCDQLPEANS